MHFLKIARNYIKHLTSYILLAIGKEKKKLIINSLSQMIEKENCSTKI